MDPLGEAGNRHFHFGAVVAGVVLVVATGLVISLLAIARQHNESTIRSVPSARSKTSEKVVHLIVNERTKSQSGATDSQSQVEIWSDRTNQRLRSTRRQGNTVLGDESYLDGKFGALEKTPGESNKSSYTSYETPFDDTATQITRYFYSALIGQDIDWGSTSAADVNDGITSSVGAPSILGDLGLGVITSTIVVHRDTSLPVLVSLFDAFGSKKLQFEYEYSKLELLDPSDVSDDIFATGGSDSADSDEYDQLTLQEARAFSAWDLYFVGEKFQQYELYRIDYHKETGSHAQMLIDFAGRGSLPIESVNFSYVDPEVQGQAGQGFDIEISPSAGYRPPIEMLNDLEDIQVAGVLPEKL